MLLVDCELEGEEISLLSTCFEMGGFENLRRLDLSRSTLLWLSPIDNNITLRACTVLFQAIAERGGELQSFQTWKSGRIEANKSKNMLQKLYIGSNRIKAKGYMFLLGLIKDGRYPQLWELDVSNNELDEKCVTSTTEWLKTSPQVSSLHQVSFSGNNVSESALKEFNRVLAISYRS